MINPAKIGTLKIAYERIPISALGRILLLACVVCLSTMGWSEAQESPNAAALAQLRTLAGDWEGPLQWSGARTGTGHVNASYYVTGNGSSVVENLAMDGTVPSMTTVYHLDGADLRMTHFCAAQNQPRLKASTIDLAKGILDFDFVDATNMASPDAPHVHGLELRLLSPDHITVTFLFQAGEKRSREFIDLKRVSHKPSA
jgi:hypothetical protein